LRAWPKIAIVGPCASGKTTLALRLRREGYSARQIVQEHSYVAEMWKVLSRPDLLIFLDASFATCNRRKALNWLEHEYLEQRRRLRHAKEHCDLYIETDALTSDEVLQSVLRALQALSPADRPPATAGPSHPTPES
jgi:deoxyadenosine/deoxycytidine kinase